MDGSILAEHKQRQDFSFKAHQAKAFRLAIRNSTGFVCYRSHVLLQHDFSCGWPYLPCCGCCGEHQSASDRRLRKHQSVEVLDALLDQCRLYRVVGHCKLRNAVALRPEQKAGPDGSQQEAVVGYWDSEFAESESCRMEEKCAVGDAGHGFGRIALDVSYTLNEGKCSNS